MISFIDPFCRNGFHLYYLCFALLETIYMAYICEYFVLSFDSVSVFYDYIMIILALKTRSDNCCYISKFLLKSLLFEFAYYYYYCSCG